MAGDDKAPLKPWDLTMPPGPEGVPPPPPPKPKIKLYDPKALADVAWGLINEAIQTKRITVPMGGALAVDDEAYVRLLQWVSVLKVKSKKSAVSKPEDFDLQETKG